MYVTTEITIDFQRPRKNVMQVVQDDTTRKIRLILKDGGNDYDITSGLETGETWVGAVAYLKSDGHGGVYDTTEDGDAAVQLVSGTTNQFDVLLVGQVFTAAGWTQVNIKFYNKTEGETETETDGFSKVLSTFALEVNVQKNAASDFESEDYTNLRSLGDIRTALTELLDKGYLCYAPVNIPDRGTISVSRSQVRPAAFDGDIVVGKNGMLGQVSSSGLRIEITGLGWSIGRLDVSADYADGKAEDPTLTEKEYLLTLSAGFYKLDSGSMVCYADIDEVDGLKYTRLTLMEDDNIVDFEVYIGSSLSFALEGLNNRTSVSTPLFVPAPELAQQVANKQYVDTKGGLTATAKQALLNCFAHVAWIDEHGQDYYDELETALMQKTLESITAVFAQGDNVIYDTDELDTLKQYLTVTAYYDNGTSATVTAYILSGTLTEGTSTITVSYGGKTATFDVNVTESTVPSGYTQYDYIALKSSASRPAAYWISLPNMTDLNALSMNLEFSVTGFSTINAILGVRSGSDAATSYSVYLNTNSAENKIAGAIRGTWYGITGTSIVLGSKNTFAYDNPANSPCVVRLNTEEKEISWDNSNVINGGLVLFANPTIGTTGNTYMFNGAKLGKIKLTESNGNVVCDCVPCVNSSGVIGMYDTVSKSFRSTSTPSYATIGNSGCIYEVGNWS